MSAIYIPMTVASSAINVPMTVSVNTEAITMALGAGITVLPAPRYSGEYEVTPSEETQVLATKGTVLQADITVAPVPSGYGRIAWNGSVITVY